MYLSERFNEIIREIRAEREIQIETFGDQNLMPTEYLLILNEEIGEVNKAACEAFFNEQSWLDYRHELMQVAAVAVAMIESFDRNSEKIHGHRKL